MSAPISRSVASSPERSGFVITPSTTTSDPGTMSAATMGNAAEDGSAGTTTGDGLSSGRPTRSILRPSPSQLTVTSAPKCAEHLLGVVARGLGLDDRRHAAGVEAGEQHRRLDLRRGDRRPVEDRRRVADAFQHDRAAPALRLRQDLGPHEPQRVQNPAHRALAERGVAVEGRGDPVAADDAHHEARAGAGVAEIERGARGKQRPEPGPADPPAARREALDRGSERPARFTRPQDVVSLEQPFDLGLAAGEQAEDEGAVGNRLVAGRPEAAAKRPAADGAQGEGGVRSGGGS